MDRKNYQILKLLVAAKRSFAISRAIALPLLIIYHLSLITVVHGAFEELNIGARPQGLGGAFTAISDDANALFYNPAGI